MSISLAQSLIIKSADEGVITLAPWSVGLAELVATFSDGHLADTSREAFWGVDEEGKAWEVHLIGR